MVKLIIFFRQPADVQAFEDHFANRHVPLISAMPNVVRTAVSRALGAPRGEPPFHLIHEVYFADMPAMTYALNSAQGRAAGADLMMFARDIVSLMFAEVWGEDPFEMGLGQETVPDAAAGSEPAAQAASPITTGPMTGEAAIPEPDHKPATTATDAATAEAGAGETAAPGPSTVAPPASPAGAAEQPELATAQEDAQNTQAA